MFGIYHTPGTVLGTSDIAMNKTKFTISWAFKYWSWQTVAHRPNVAHCMFLLKVVLETWPHSVVHMLSMAELSILHIV